MLKLLVLVLFLTATNAQAQAKLIFTSDFETGAIQSATKNPDGWGDQSLPGGATVLCNAVNPAARRGKCLVKFTLTKSDWLTQTTKPRVQLSKGAGPMYAQHVEYWIGASTYVPQDWRYDNNPDNQTVFWQIHGSGDAGSGVSPPLALVLKSKTLFVTNKSGQQGRSGWLNATKTLAPLALGKWEDWIIRVRFSQVGTDGQLQIWRNGALVWERLNMPNLYYVIAPNTDKTYQLLSLYKGKFVTAPTSVSKNVMYYDSIKIAEGPNGRELVSP